MLERPSSGASAIHDWLGTRGVSLSSPVGHPGGTRLHQQSLSIALWQWYVPSKRLSYKQHDGAGFVTDLHGATYPWHLSPRPLSLGALLASGIAWVIFSHAFLANLF